MIETAVATENKYKMLFASNAIALFVNTIENLISENETERVDEQNNNNNKNTKEYTIYEIDCKFNERFKLYLLNIPF